MRGGDELRRPPPGLPPLAARPPQTLADSLGEKFATGLNGAFECQIFTVATPIPDGGFDKNAQRVAQAKALGLFS